MTQVDLQILVSNEARDDSHPRFLCSSRFLSSCQVKRQVISCLELAGEKVQLDHYTCSPTCSLMCIEIPSPPFRYLPIGIFPAIGLLGNCVDYEKTSFTAFLTIPSLLLGTSSSHRPLRLILMPPDSRITRPYYPEAHHMSESDRLM